MATLEGIELPRPLLDEFYPQCPVWFDGGSFTLKKSADRSFSLTGRAQLHFKIDRRGAAGEEQQLSFSSLACLGRSDKIISVYPESCVNRHTQVGVMQCHCTKSRVRAFLSTED